MSDNRSRLLVIDDDPNSRAVIKEMLKQKGFTVASACGVNDAKMILISALKDPKQQFDLILMDLYLDKQNGIDFLATIRKERLIRCPVMMMSGIHDAGKIQEAGKAGICGFLVKPFSTDLLEQRISAAIAKSKNQPANQPSRAAPVASK